MNDKARWHGYLWQRRVAETEGASASLTKEMRMDVVVAVGIVAVAQFEASASGAVVDGVHQSVFSEERQSPEHPRLVYRHDAALQFHERQRASGLSQRPHHHDAVCRSLHAMRLEQHGEFVLCFHIRYCYRPAKVQLNEKKTKEF